MTLTKKWKTIALTTIISTHTRIHVKLMLIFCKWFQVESSSWLSSSIAKCDYIFIPFNPCLCWKWFWSCFNELLMKIISFVSINFFGSFLSLSPPLILYVNATHLISKVYIYILYVKCPVTMSAPLSKEFVTEFIIMKIKNLWYPYHFYFKLWKHLYLVVFSLVIWLPLATCGAAML